MTIIFLFFSRYQPVIYHIIKLTPGSSAGVFTYQPAEPQSQNVEHT